MKLLTVRAVFIGCSLKEITVTVDEDKTFKQLVDEHYHDLLPRSDRFDTTQPQFFGAWENLNETSLSYFDSCYSFSAFQSVNPHIPVHLIDRIRHIKSDKITITSPGFRHDDSIAFFLIEKYDQVLNAISTENNRNRLREKLREFLEELLGETDSHILVDTFSENEAEDRIAPFVDQMIPSALWLNLTKESLSYYRKFILHLANQVLILDYCVKHSNLEDRNIFEEISRGWVDQFLYRIQNLMLVLLNIPEAFFRSIYSSHANYSKLVKNIGIKRLQEKDEEYYTNYIMNKSISEIYFELFNNLSISNYQDYIEFCENAPLSDINLGRIVHTYRILFNKLKHSSCVEIIKSRDYESIRKKELEDIEQEIERFQTMQQIDAQYVTSELERLKIKKEIAEKVRYTYAHLDFEDTEFKRSNGISVVDERGTRFRITLFDMELSFKVLFGILCILNRANTTQVIQSTP